MNRWGWQAGRTEKEKAEIWKDYQAVFADILPKTVANLNAEINYWESSPNMEEEIQNMNLKVMRTIGGFGMMPLRLNILKNKFHVL